jgi:hypothetical protein
MSHQLINRSADLKRLRDEGYGVEVKSGHLLITNVPYVNANKEVKFGTLVSELTLVVGDVTTRPGSHVAYFVGEHPCDQDGEKLSKFVIGSDPQQLGSDLQINQTFSAKPLSGGYDDYYHKVSTYVALLSGPAEKLDSTVTAHSFPLVMADETNSVFVYEDTASSRAGINIVTEKLKLDKIAIIGLGGTGSYVLDLIAKTPVQEIHLFDRDEFLQHNAFRAPGAPIAGQFGTSPKKVAYFAEIYSRMRRGIISHDYHVDESNVAELRDMNFVFLCIDAGDAKRVIVENLEAFGIPFIDVGLGVDQVGDSLRGIVRVTASTIQQRGHFRERVSLADAGIDADYDRNIQIADLNALNATLAVIKWKKICGFYLDFENEYHSTYTIDVNMLLSEAQL